MDILNIDFNNTNLNNNFDEDDLDTINMRLVLLDYQTYTIRLTLLSDF